MSAAVTWLGGVFGRGLSLPALRALSSGGPSSLVCPCALREPEVPKELGYHLEEECIAVQVRLMSSTVG